MCEGMWDERKSGKNVILRELCQSSSYTPAITGPLMYAPSCFCESVPTHILPAELIRVPTHILPAELIRVPTHILPEELIECQ